MNLENLADRSLNFNPGSRQHELLCREFDEGLLGPNTQLVLNQFNIIKELSFSEAVYALNAELAFDRADDAIFPLALTKLSVDWVDGMRERRGQLEDLILTLKSSKEVADKFYVNYMDRVFHKLADLTANIPFYQEMDIKNYKSIFCNYLAYLYYALLKDRLAPACYDDLMAFNTYINSVRDRKQSIQ
jgi:hypothetical protein